MQCHSGVEGTSVVVLLYRSLQGTAVLLDGTTMGTVRRRQYGENRSSSKTQSKAAFL